MDFQIYLIRHGETDWSKAGLHTGRTDIALNATGEADARAMGERLRGIAFSHIFSSPRQRAQQTGTLAGFADRMVVEPDLAEWDYGDYEGRRTAEIVLEQPGWNVFHHGCPNGESPAQVAERADRLIARLRGLSGNIALFSHAHFGRMLGARWIGLPPVEAQHFFLSTASVSALGYEHGKADEPVITFWNARRD